MSKVLITRSKLDSLATTISAKSGEPLPLTIAQMDAAVQGIETGGNDLIVTLSYNESTEMWEPDCTYAEAYAAYQDGKEIVFVTTEYNESHPPVYGGYAAMFNAFRYIVIHPIVIDYDRAGHTTMDHFWEATRVYIAGSSDAWYTRDATAQPSQVAEGAVFYNANGKQVGTFDSTPSLQSKSVSYTPSETAQSATVTADSGYDGMSSVDVSVGAISSTYVGSGINRHNAYDVTEFDDRDGHGVMIPGGYYDTTVLAYVADGTEGTPTATKGTVSNHSVTVTPSVTNGAGYIAGGTHSGTAVTVSASELVSGTKAITGAGTTDVTEYASASVASGGATPSATKGTVSNHSVTVTPSVTRTAGWVSAGSSNGTAVTVSASELVSGTYTVDSSGTHDVTEYASASVAAGGATASATKGSVSNHSVTVTPSVTRTAGYVTAGTANGTPVTVSASELVSGSETKTANGTYDVTNLASLVVDIDFVTYHTSSSEPTSSQGSDGDIWLVTE